MKTRITNIFNKLYPPLEKAGNALWKGLSFSLADPVFSFAKVVCISIETGGVYLAYAEKKLWKMNIRHFKSYPLPEHQKLSPDFAAASAADFVKQFGIANACFILGLPRSWAIVQTVDFPIAAKEDLSKVVAFELDRVTPLSRNNAYHDYVVLGEEAQTIKTMLAVVRADQINAYLDAFKAKNISIEKINLGVFMIRRLIQNTYPGVNTAYVTVKDGAYEGGVAVNDVTVRSFAGCLDENDERAFDGLVAQTQASMADLIQRGVPPRIVVDADESRYNALRDKFMPLAVSHLNKDMKLPAPGQSRDLSAAALGGLLGAGGRRPDAVNLLSNNDQGSPRSPWLFTLILSAAIFSIGTFWLIAPLQYGQQQLDALDHQIRALKPEVRKVEALKTEEEKIQADISAVDMFKKQNDLTVDIIKDMTDILPSKTWLTRLKITETGVEIDGYTGSATDIILKLENSKYFQKVEFASPTFRDPRLNTDRFVIRMELKNKVNQAQIKKEQKADQKDSRKKNGQKRMDHETI